MIFEWAPQDYASVVGAMVSVTGACVSWWWTRKRLRWDAGKELGEFRAETLQIINMAFRLDNPTWRRVGMRDFSLAHRQVRLRQRAPIIGHKAYREVLRIAELLDQAKSEALAMPLGGLAAEEAQYDENFYSNDLSRNTSEALSRFQRRIEQDPVFLTR